MNCKQAQTSISAYQDKELSAQETMALESHVQGCPSCKAELGRMSRTWEILQTLETIQPSPDFKARFWEKVREEETKPGLWDWMAWPRLVPALAGVMALWVLGMGSGLYLFERHSTPLTPGTRTALTIFTSSYPPNSIEQIYLQGNNDGRHA